MLFCQEHCEIMRFYEKKSNIAPTGFHGLYNIGLMRKQKVA